MTDELVRVLRAVLELFLQEHVEAVFEEHRLAYRYADTDTDPSGAVTELFVCKCGDAYDRRKFNNHLKEKLKEVD